MTISKTLFSSKKMDWETPQLFFEELNKKYKFDLDACASDDNHKVDNYFTEEDNALTKLWNGNVFVNPPYGRELYSFVEKSYSEHSRDNNRFIVLLIPDRTDTKYWHEFIQGKAAIKFLKGRLKFEISGIASDAAPFPSALIIYGI
ncbi:DNA N-6-adenine-methyltransferase [Leuconostoc citreum]|uniref:DNA N-6-adenine-methyltransferase n=1 Tax=Leuconostoc citreum TaxID=33964 RepID=UPI0032DFA668